MDVRITNHGNLFGFELLSDRAQEWVDDNVAYEGWQFMGHTLMVDHGYALDLAAGMQDAGLEVE